jgi:hypothetical protein
MDHLTPNHSLLQLPNQPNQAVKWLAQMYQEAPQTKLLQLTQLYNNLEPRAIFLVEVQPETGNKAQIVSFRPL